ncbi:MAG: hypothetical protein ACK5U7_07600 [Bacteroidota bacterium]
MPTSPTSNVQFRENRVDSTVAAQTTNFEVLQTDLTVAQATFDPYRVFNGDDAGIAAVDRPVAIPVGATFALIHQILPIGVTGVSGTKIRAAGLLPAYANTSGPASSDNTAKSWRQFNTNQAAAQLDAHGIWTPLGNLTTQEYDITLPTEIAMQYHTNGMRITRPFLLHTLGCSQLLVVCTTAATYTGTATGNGLLVCTFGK